MVRLSASEVSNVSAGGEVTGLVIVDGARAPGEVPAMCELLGMVSNVPTDIVFSFPGLALRGGRTGPHADGWGVSLYDGLFARTFLEPHPAFSSPLARFIRENPIPRPSPSRTCAR